MPQSSPSPSQRHPTRNTLMKIQNTKYKYKCKIFITLQGIASPILDVILNVIHK